MSAALAGGASLEEADGPYEKVVEAAEALLLVALAPKRLGAGAEEDAALAVVAGLLAPKVKVVLGALGESGQRRENKVAAG